MKPISSRDARPVIRTVAELQEHGLADVIVKTLSEVQTAHAALLNAGVPPERLPRDTPTAIFWPAMFHEFENGIIEDGFNMLLIAAARLYPGNPRLAPWREASDAPPQAGAEPVAPRGAGLSIIGFPGSVADLLDTIRISAKLVNLPGEVDIRVANGSTTSFFFPEATADHVRLLQDSLIAERGFHVTLTRLGFRDYLIHRIYGEAADGSRLVFENVPASTLISTLANVAMETFASPSDADGEPRPVVLDIVRGEGNNRLEQRADPEQDLDEAGIREGDMCQVSPQSNAASVNPYVREQALARVWAQMRRLRASRPDIRLDVNSLAAPTEYYLHFNVPSWGPPPAHGEMPVPIDEHQVLLRLSHNFPMEAPFVYWMTPIFHPNIRPWDSFVCLGELQEAYIPGMDFARLCQLLIDIAGYRNYGFKSFWNGLAGKWANSPEGQEMIVARGGKSTGDMFMRQVRAERQHQAGGFRVRRLDTLPARDAKDAWDHE